MGGARGRGYRRPVTSRRREGLPAPVDRCSSSCRGVYTQGACRRRATARLATGVVPRLVAGELTARGATVRTHGRTAHDGPLGHGHPHLHERSALSAAGDPAGVDREPPAAARDPAGSDVVSEGEDRIRAITANVTRTRRTTSPPPHQGSADRRPRGDYDRAQPSASRIVPPIQRSGG